MKYILLVSLLLIFSCEKKAECYKCTTTHLTTTSAPIDGYPKLYLGDTVELCDKDTAQIAEYEQLHKGTNTAIVEGVIYTYSYETECYLR